MSEGCLIFSNIVGRDRPLITEVILSFDPIITVRAGREIQVAPGATCSVEDDDSTVVIGVNI